MKNIDGYTHEWTFDLPWHMVDIRDWFYMVNVGYIYPTVFLHVRVFGVRSLWTFTLPTPTAADFLMQGAKLAAVYKNPTYEEWLSSEFRSMGFDIKPKEKQNVD